jgi:ClpX C4-type zinc finger
VLHPELALIPIFMVSDYVLTLVGARLYGGTPDARAAYELNPRYRDMVARLRPMPVPLMLRCVLMAALLALMGATLHSAIGGMGYAALVGVLIAAYALINGAHVANILALRQRNKDTGPVTERRRQFSAAYRHFGSSFLPLAVLAAWMPSPFSVGAALGGLFLAVTHLRWALASPASAPAPRPAVPPGLQQAGQSCGFCGRPAAQVPVLIAGKTAGICSECVATSAAMLAERAAASVPSAT